MKWMKNIFFDIIKCIVIGSAIAIATGIITGIIAAISSRGDFSIILNWIKRATYIVGGLAMFLAAGAFAHRDGTRPFIYNDEWKAHFKILNIGFVILFIAFSIVSWGMMVQNYIELGRII